MLPPEGLSSEIHAELTRRHRSVALCVRGILTLIIVLPLLALIAHSHFRHQENDVLDRALRITILIFGLGSVFLRRIRFSPTRLQSIAALQGVSGLLGTLASTALQVALLGAAVTILGFIAAVMTGNEFYSYGAGVVGFVVLLYGYPVRSSWQQTVRRFAPPLPETGR